MANEAGVVAPVPADAVSDVADDGRERGTEAMPISVLLFMREFVGNQPASAVPPGVDDRHLRFRDTWRADVPAALVVFLIAIPLCLGIAHASGAPLFAGIIAGIVGGAVVGALSGSQLMVSGPAAGLTAIVISGIATLGSFQAFLVAVVLAGVFQVVLGLIGAGVIGYMVPMAVIKGMLAAIGLILILKQLPHAAGYSADYVGDETFRQANNENTFTALVTMTDKLQPTAVALSVLSLGILFIWSAHARLRQARLMPGPLAAVLVCTFANVALARWWPQWALGPELLVALPVQESWADYVALLVTPDWSALGRPQTWVVALTIGVVASLETLLSLGATNRIDPFRREPSTNRELIAQGVGNGVSGLIGGLPITGVIVRSATNVSGGARSKAATVMQGGLLLVAALTIPSLLDYIPIAPLAVILIYIGYRLAHPRLVAHIWRQGPTQFIPFIVTVIAILLTDLLLGIAIGLAVGLMFVLIDNLRMVPFSVVGAPGSVLTRLRLHDSVSFLNKAALAETLEGMANGSRLEIDGRGCQRIDHDVLELIHEFRETARLRGIDYRLVGIPAESIMPTQ